MAMETTPVPPQKNTKTILWILLGVFLATAAAGFFLVKAPENLSPELKQLRTHFESQGVEISGSQVRRESALVRDRAIFSTERAGQKYFFFVERCSGEEQAIKRAAELSAMPFVTTERVVRKGVFVLSLSNDWDPQDSLAQKVKAIFQNF